MLISARFYNRAPSFKAQQNLTEEFASVLAISSILLLSTESKSPLPSCLWLKATAHSPRFVAGILLHHASNDSADGASLPSCESPVAALAADKQAVVGAVTRGSNLLERSRCQMLQENLRLKKDSTGPIPAPGPPVVAPVDENAVGAKMMRGVDSQGAHDVNLRRNPRQRRCRAAKQHFASAHFAASSLQGVDSLEGHRCLTQMLGGPCLAADTVVVVWLAPACLSADCLCCQGVQSYC